MRRKFVRYISHELRTPLNIVYVGINLLQKMEDVDAMKSKNEEKLQTIEEISNSCDLALSTLNALLYFDKLEGGQLIIEPRDMMVTDFIKSAMRPFRKQVVSYFHTYP